MNDYEEKKQARIDRYRERAEKARARSSQLSHESVSMLEHIPPGQPILADHHSARGHRKLLERSDRKMEQSIAASEKADYYEHKARRRRTTPPYRQMTRRRWKSCKRN